MMSQCMSSTDVKHMQNVMLRSKSMAIVQSYGGTGMYGQTATASRSLPGQQRAGADFEYTLQCDHA